MGIAILLLLFLAGACCTNRYPGTDASSFSYAYTDTTLLFDSVYNIEHQKLVWSKDRIRINDTLIPADSSFVWLSLDPLREYSSFAFYYSYKPPDTLRIDHEFEIKYDECDDYYFEAISRSLAHATFADTVCKFYKDGQCESFIARFY